MRTRTMATPIPTEEDTHMARYKSLDALLAAERKWRTKQTIAVNKLATIHKQLREEALRLKSQATAVQAAIATKPKVERKGNRKVQLGD